MRIRFAKQAAKDLEVTAAFWKERWPGVPFALVDDVIALADRLARGIYHQARRPITR